MARCCPRLAPAYVDPNLHRFARDKEWDQFFWTHPDLLVLSNENEESVRSAYIKAVEILRELKNKKLRWANYFFECDRMSNLRPLYFTALQRDCYSLELTILRPRSH
jgi:hypothetical protein